MAQEKIHASIQVLRQLYAEDEGSRAFFRHLADRKQGPLRKRSVTALHDKLLKLGSELTRPQLIAILKRLDAFGYGQFLVGRHGKPSRFLWKANSTSVGMVAAAQSEHIEWLADELNDEAQLGDEVEMLAHSFRLRHDLTVTFSLPSDFTPSEAQRLAGFMTTLPFEQDDD